MFEFGSGTLYGYANAGNLPTNPTPTKFGTLQEVSVDISGDIKELYGQLQLPVAVARGKVKLSGKAKFATINGKILNDLFFAQTTAVGTRKWALGVSATVTAGAATPAVPGGGTFVNDYGVVYSTTGLALVRVGSAPAVGQYVVNEGTGAYTFNTGDNGAVVLFDFSYTPATNTTGQTITVVNQLMGYAPQFQCALNHQYQGNAFTWLFNAAIATKLTYATKLDDFTIPEFDFSLFVDASNTLCKIFSDQ